MLNWYLRYEPFIELLEAADAGTVLDVGSGWSGLSWYWDRPVVQTDFTLEGEPPSRGRTGQATFVQASADRLPFADDSFDFVVSSDLIEHLPHDVRAESVRELIRVAKRGVIVGFPTGEAAKRLDAILSSLISLCRKPRPHWLEEHLAQDAYPDQHTVIDVMPPGWQVVSRIKNGNVIVQFVVVVAELTPGLRRAMPRMERMTVRRGVSKRVHHRPTMREIYQLECRPDRPESPSLPR